MVDGVIGSFKQITAVGPGHDLFIFAGKTVDGYIHQPLTRLVSHFLNAVLSFSGVWSAPRSAESSWICSSEKYSGLLWETIFEWS